MGARSRFLRMHNKFNADYKMLCDVILLQLGEHEKALRLLVHQLDDHAAAESYCLRHAAQDSDTVSLQGRQLFHTLLGIYLDPHNE